MHHDRSGPVIRPSRGVFDVLEEAPADAAALAHRIEADPGAPEGLLKRPASQRE